MHTRTATSELPRDKVGRMGGRLSTTTSLVGNARFEDFPDTLLLLDLRTVRDRNFDSNIQGNEFIATDLL